jgi:hypothetical protein
MPKINIQELEKAVELELNNSGLVLEAKIHRGSLTDSQNLPSIRYKAKPGKESQLKELRESILRVLLKNTSEGITIQNDYDESTETHTDRLRLDPSVHLNQRQEIDFRYHILYHIRKEVDNFYNRNKGNHR